MGAGFLGGFYLGEYPTGLHHPPVPPPAPIVPPFQGLPRDIRPVGERVYAGDRGVTPSHRHHGL